MQIPSKVLGKYKKKCTKRPNNIKQMQNENCTVIASGVPKVY